jgi:hypothetical protein
MQGFPKKKKTHTHTHTHTHTCRMSFFKAMSLVASLHWGIYDFAAAVCYDVKHFSLEALKYLSWNVSLPSVNETGTLKYELYAKSFCHDKGNYVLLVKACRSSFFKDNRKGNHYILRMRNNSKNICSDWTTMRPKYLLSVSAIAFRIVTSYSWFICEVLWRSKQERGVIFIEIKYLSCIWLAEGS